MTNFLITGGAGFIGSHLIESLLSLESDINIYCVDNFDVFYSKSIKMKNIGGLINNERFTLIESDILNDDLYSKLSNLNIDCVVHLAALAGVRPSILNSQKYIDVNITGTNKILNFAKNNKIKKFVFISSSSVYGINENSPWVEDEILLPISPYAATKIAGENLCRVYSQLYGINIIALRLFTVYGPRQRPDLAINKFVNNILNDKLIELYGKGDTYRDYTYIDDIIKGISSAIFSDINGYEAINLGSDSPIKLIDLIKVISEITKCEPKIQYLDYQDGDVPLTFANINKAARLLKYKPQTSLNQGVELYYKWIVKNQ